MRLEKLLERIDYELVQGTAEIKIEALSYDSRNVSKDSVFVCIRGAVRDGHDYAVNVVNKGAVALIVEHEVKVPEHVTVIRVKDTRSALSCMSAAYFGYPAERLVTIGVTGTKGKTTTVYMIQAMLEQAGLRTGLIGTIETVIGKTRIPSSNTTPESYLIQKYFREMADAGIRYVVMEVSSQGLMLHRVGGFTFDYGIFTNLEPDHIGPNEHASFEEYVRCKGLLFRQCRHGIVNIDDSHVKEVLEGHTCSVESYGLGENAGLRAENIRLLEKPGTLGVVCDMCGSVSLPVEIALPGTFSVYNALAATSLGIRLGVEPDTIREVLSRIKVKGRAELVPVQEHFTLMIDYAHNAMSLESLLTTLREYQPKRLICMFGCGGNRSRLRRYEMGEVASRLADLTVITSDNPRDEEPEAIMEDIYRGVKRADGDYVMIKDRREAIRYCIARAEEGDIIVLAGKGHEDYQEIHGKKYHMDERELVQEVLQEEKQKLETGCKKHTVVR